MKKLLILCVAACGILLTSQLDARADHRGWGGGRSNFGISISYGNGFGNGLNMNYGRGNYGNPYGYRPYSYGSPVIYSNPGFYSVPVAPYRSYGGYGGYGGFGGYGGGHRHCR